MAAEALARPLPLVREWLACPGGTAILEFALVLPLILALVFGSFELGRALLVHQAMNEGARAGARALARVPDPTCRPACTAEVARALELASEAIAENTRLPRRSIRVAPLERSAEGLVGVEAEVTLGNDFLSTIGLNHLLTLRTTRYEAWLAP